MLSVFHRTYTAIFRRYPMLGRMALVVLLAEILFAAVNNFAISFYVHDDLHLPMRTAGIIISTFLAAEMLLKFPAGHLSDRYGRRHFASLGLAACISTPLALLAIPAQWLVLSPLLIFAVILPLRVLDGAGSAALWPPLFASVSDHVPTEERGVAMSVMNSAYLAGLALGPALAGVAMKIATTSGHPELAGKSPFAMVIVFGLIGAAVAWTLPAQRTREEEGGGNNRRLLPPMGIVALVVAITFCDMFATATLAPYVAPYLRQVGHIDRSNVGLVMLLLAVPAAILGMPIGHLTDRWPKRRVVQIALWTTAAGLWSVSLSRTLPYLIASGMVVMLGFMFGLPAWLALISDMAPKGSSGKVMGLMAAAQGFGAFLGPYVGGTLWDRDPTHRLPFYLAAAVLSISALIALVFINRVVGAGGTNRRNEPVVRSGTDARDRL